MGEHDALGLARGSGGVRKHCQMRCRIKGYLRRREVGPGDLGQRQSSVHRVDGDHAGGVDPRDLRGLECARQQRRHREDELGLGIDQLFGQFLGGVQHVDRAGSAAGAQDAVQHYGEGRAVGQEYRRDISDTEPAFGQPCRRRVNLRTQLAEGGLSAGEPIDQRDAAVFFTCITEHVLVDRAVGNRNVWQRASEGHARQSCTPRLVPAECPCLPPGTAVSRR
ncbi:Uncharacterised protein [Mycobacteroides abscessus]|nr:Uncharacterised protein [Mycobacteroides abscessus]